MALLLSLMYWPHACSLDVEKYIDLKVINFDYHILAGS
jgi:hypothetical protein